MIQKLLELWTNWRSKKDLEKHSYGKFFATSHIFQAHFSTNLETHIQYGLPFEVLQGRFKGVVFSFLTISLEEDRIRFNFDIHQKPEWVSKRLFEPTARKILCSILMQSVQNNETHGTGIIKDDEIRNDDTQELAGESRVLSPRKDIGQE